MPWREESTMLLKLFYFALGAFAQQKHYGDFKLLSHEGHANGKCFVITTCLASQNKCIKRATVSQHPPAHHPLDAPYYSIMDVPQLS
jgi:hypothetical protein